MNSNEYASKILKEYSAKETTKLDELKALDKKVKFPARLFAYIFGSVGALVLGVGMCLAMAIIGSTTFHMILGIAIGLLGITMVSTTYPIYVRVLETRKNKYSNEIITKSNELLNK